MYITAISDSENFAWIPIGINNNEEITIVQ